MPAFNAGWNEANERVAEFKHSICRGEHSGHAAGVANAVFE